MSHLAFLGRHLLELVDMSGGEGDSCKSHLVLGLLLLRLGLGVWGKRGGWIGTGVGLS